MNSETGIIAALVVIAVVGITMAIRGYRRDRPPPRAEKRLTKKRLAEYPDDYNPAVFRD